MTFSDLLNRGLPKWPQMITTGHPVSVDQAKEIIRRTDSFFCYLEYSGNDREHVNRLLKMFKIPHIDDKINSPVSEKLSIYHAQDQWCKKWGYIFTNYVHNDWISTSFIGGPHGWCHPSGVIGFIDNVGKWPDVGDIQQDWQILASEFPFLDIGVTLHSGEECEDNTYPVVSIRVQNGKALLVDPEVENVHEGHQPASRNDTGLTEDEIWERRLSTFDRTMECGIDDSWFEEWAKR